jgi:hypothetical protein
MTNNYIGIIITCRTKYQSFDLREKHRLRLSENRVLKGISEAQWK